MDTVQFYKHCNRKILLQMIFLIQRLPLKVFKLKTVLLSAKLQQLVLKYKNTYFTIYFKLLPIYSSDPVHGDDT